MVVGDVKEVCGLLQEMGIKWIYSCHGAGGSQWCTTGAGRSRGCIAGARGWGSRSANVRISFSHLHGASYNRRDANGTFTFY